MQQQLHFYNIRHVCKRSPAGSHSCSRLSVKDLLKLSAGFKAQANLMEK